MTTLFCNICQLALYYIGIGELVFIYCLLDKDFKDAFFNTPELQVWMITICLFAWPKPLLAHIKRKYAQIRNNRS